MWSVAFFDYSATLMSSDIDSHYSYIANTEGFGFFSAPDYKMKGVLIQLS